MHIQKVLEFKIKENIYIYQIYKTQQFYLIFFLISTNKSENVM
jgi:hypothetical protein